MEGILSVVSYQPAEICHHLERRLTNPTAILNPFKLAPITGREHGAVHSGKLLLSSTTERKINVVDTNGARFISDTTEFCKLWQHYLDLWWQS